MGPAGNIPGPDHQIPAILGTQRGGNLFHSFGLFNVSTGGSATFHGPNSVNNIIGRVTGGSVSSIDGAIQSTITGANLFLINPSGIVFGPNATLQVSGSFYASTAHYVTLGTDGRFDTLNTNFVLSTAPPSAFGFTGAPIAGITVNGSMLSGEPGRGLTLVGGTIQITGGTLSAPAGRLNLASVASAGEVSLSSDAGGFPAGLAGGSIDIVNGVLEASSTVGGAPGGRVVIRGGRLTLQQDTKVLVQNDSAVASQGIVLDGSEAITLTNSTLSANASGAGAAGGISVTTPTFTLEDSIIRARSSGPGNAGDITLNVDRLVLTGTAQVDSSAFGAGGAGNLTVIANESIAISGTSPLSGLISVTTDSGAGGAILLRSPAIEVTGARVSVDALGSGTPGNVTIEADTLALIDGGVISSTSRAGAGSLVNIAATGSFSISGEDTTGTRSSVTATNRGAGAGNDIKIVTPVLTLDNGRITAATEGAGAAGNIEITAAQRIALMNGALLDSSTSGAGAGGNVTIDTAKLEVSTAGQIVSEANAGGAGGRVSITASESATITGPSTRTSGSGIFVSANGAGDGGGITLATPVLNLDGGAIVATTFGAGNAGDVSISGNRVNVTAGGLVDSGAFGAGAAGNLLVVANESLAISGKNDAGRPSGLFSATAGDGAGGGIVLRSPSIAVSGGLISVDATGAGAPGSVTIEADTLALVDGGTISSTSRAPGAGSRVNITATESFAISGEGAAGNASGVNATNRGEGGGNDILIVTPLMTLDKGRVTAEAQGAGAAGNIAITTDRLALTNGALIDSSTSGAGAGGNITINAATLEVSDAGQIVSNASGRGAGGRVRITASESATITGPATLPTSGSGLFVVTDGVGDSGDILLTTPMLELNGGAIAASTGGAGKAGNVSIDVDRVKVTAGGFIDSSSRFAGDSGRVLIDAAQDIAISGMSADGISSRVSSTALGSGRGGEIFMRAPLITLDGGRVLADARGSGIGGRIAVETERLLLVNGGHLSSGAADDAIGGIVNVTASEAVSITDLAAGPTSAGLFAATLGRGRGGEIIVTAPMVTIDGGTISSTTFGGGEAGRINIQAQQVAVIGGGLIDSSSAGGVGAAGFVNVTASESIEVMGRNIDGIPSSISSRTFGIGRGGDLLLSTPMLAVDDAAILVDTLGRGSAGRMQIEADRVTVSGGGRLSSGTGAQGGGGLLLVTATESIVVSGRNSDGRSRITNVAGGAGDAGQISLSAPRISIEDAGFVNGSATQSGAAGSIAVRAGSLTLTSAEISTDTTRFGAGGSIDIVATDSVVLTGSAISATSAGTGDAGSIFIDAGRSLVLNGSAITTAAARADGGNIEIIAIDLLRLNDSRITTSVGTGSGDGGNIKIDPVFVILDSSQIIANAFGGDGGNIGIVTSALLQSGDSIISASSQLGIQGTIRISAPESDLAGGLTPLPGGLFDPSLLLRESCSARAGRGGNSFVGVGYGGLPDHPGTLAFSSYAQRAPGSAQESAPLFALAGSFENACVK